MPPGAPPPTCSSSTPPADPAGRHGRTGSRPGPGRPGGAGAPPARRPPPLHPPAGRRTGRDAALAHPAVVAGAGFRGCRGRRPRVHRRRHRGAGRAVEAHRLGVRGAGHGGLDRPGDRAGAVTARGLADRHARRRPDPRPRGRRTPAGGAGRRRGGRPRPVAAAPARAGLRVAPPSRGERGPTAGGNRCRGPSGARRRIRRPRGVHLAQPRHGRARAGRDGGELREHRRRGHRPPPRPGGEDRRRRRAVHRGRRRRRRGDRAGPAPTRGTPRTVLRCASVPPTARC